jgi:hypothetical protein
MLQPMPTAATRVRVRVLGFAFLLAVVTYLDRICISARRFIMEDLHLTILQMSAVFSAFTSPTRCSRFRPAGSATSGDRGAFSRASCCGGRRSRC